MSLIIGVESTAHTFGVGIVRNGKVIANVKDTYTTDKGGIIPMESAKHHKEVAEKIYSKALEEAGISEKEIEGIAFSQAPGLAPCLIEGMKFAKLKSKELKKPLIPVNHCVAHLEIGGITGAKNPVMIYTSGANTQVIAYESEKYRIFGETLDIGIGNFIDNFARYLGMGFPGGPAIEKLALKGNEYIELPYKVKGMDIVLSGILTNLKHKVEKMNKKNDKLSANKSSKVNEEMLTEKNLLLKISSRAGGGARGGGNKNTINMRASASDEINYTSADLAYSMQETVFAMMVEIAERALAHTGKNELLLGGGVGCNKRLQEMCRIMCKERGAKFFVPENSLLVDNGAMIAYLGEIMFESGIKYLGEKAQELDIKPRQRTDEVEVSWKN